MSLVGRHVGRYRIIEQLGQGGMSVVYKGVDTALNREVAVKVLHPHLASRVESRKRLEREAQAVARLSHPNILEVFDFAQGDADDAYIVTEYIRGQTLREFLVEETLQPPEIAALVVHTLSAALAHAHEAGVLHRDLKPENVMIREDGTLKLMDFGIAKLLDHTEKMTVTGALVGSPAHMAPEIIEGEEAGASADVFSLGTMLYLFATGALPFAAPNTTATLKRILDGIYVDPRQLVPTVSDELAEIIATCLKRQPSARYADAGELRDALGAWLKSLGIERPQEELPGFFVEPKAFRRALVPRITQAVVARAEELLRDHKVARSMAALNYVLAHEPLHPRAAELLGQMQARGKREKRNRRLRRSALAAGLGFVGLMAGIKGVEVATRPPDFTPPASLAPTDVTLGHFEWPERPEETPAPQAPAPKASPASSAPQIRHGPELIDLVVVVRPFGFVQVDEGPRSADALARHTIKLTPGPHRFTVTCDACDPSGRTVERTVAAGQELPLIAPLRPSLVSFSGFPDDARVRVGGSERSVAEAKEVPFRIETPPSGSTKMQHLVEYEVTLGGTVLANGTRWIEPGKATLVERGAP